MEAARRGSGGGRRPVHYSACCRAAAVAAVTSSSPCPWPEKKLNCFVRAIAMMERLGNALGTLAFTWATVILLGGYPTVLRRGDFAFAAFIVFLETARMFSRDNRMDYQLFFRSRGSVRPLGWSGLVVVAWLSSIMVMLLDLWRAVYMARLAWILNLVQALMTSVVILTAGIGKLLSPGALKLLSRPIRCAIWLSSPLVAVLLMVPPLVKATSEKQANMVARWAVFILLFVVVLLLTVSRLHLPRIAQLLADTGLGTKARYVFWRQLILNLCMLAELVMLGLIIADVRCRIGMIVFQACVLVSMSFGNLLIPTACLRIAFASLRLVRHDYSGSDKEHHESKINLAPSLNIFYVMVLCQGILYLVSCILEMFSFIPQRFLARQGGFRGHRGLESVNLYYIYALEKYMERDVLAQKQISLGSFAIHSISSDSPKQQLHGVLMMHNLLHKEPSRTRLLSKFHASSSRDAVARLISMLQWRNPEDTTIRLFAAKVIAMLAGSIQIITIPGALQAFSVLLDVGSAPERGKTLLSTVRDHEQAGTKQDIVLLSTVRDHEQAGTKQDIVTVDARTSSNIQQEGHHLVLDIVDHNPAAVHLQHSIQMQQAGGIHDEHNSSCVLRCWRQVLAFWSVPQEDPLTDHDILPALGMSILDNLISNTSYDLQNNCLKISKGAQYLIPKIVRFTCCNNGMQKLNFNEAQRRLLMESSLKLLERLSSIDEAIDITLRHRLTEHPILLSNLASILDDRCFSSQEARKLAMAVLRNLAIDSNTCQEIGRIRLIISRMMDEFLNRAAHSGTNPDQHLQKVAGQALAVLTMQSADSCASILMEPGNFIGELTSMVRENRQIYVAYTLLQNLLRHIKPPNNLTNSNLRELLCSTLPMILGSIMMQTEGEELEILIGLSSQICKVIPEDFARELENSQRKERFLKRLVDTLEANMNPAVHYPRIRRVIIEQAIYLMEYSCQYAVFFNQHSMMEALLVVEQTTSTIERYRIFLGNEGFMEHKEPLTDLVATAKGLMYRQLLGGIN